MVALSFFKQLNLFMYNPEVCTDILLYTFLDYFHLLVWQKVSLHGMSWGLKRDQRLQMFASYIVLGKDFESLNITGIRLGR